MAETLEIKDLHVEVDGHEILKGVDITINGGEFHAIMGPNGTGKSTLAAVIMGHPSYDVTKGSITYNGEDVLEMEVDERARAGLFLAMQYPSEISGVTTSEFLRTAINAKRGEGNEIQLMEFIQELDGALDTLEIDQKMAQRYLNDGFSGGEKKRNEILQMMMLKPGIAILDEVDSGLDIDALQVVANAVNEQRSDAFGCLIITHYQRLLNYIKPDFVHVIMQGRIVKSGGPELAERLEAEGYEWIKEEQGIEDVTVGKNS
ncbi:MAG TPA: Fe-S cluster assembly ATPase SufC [Bacillota bacterium]|nr:Fe-S cluster assembly ATPase SufC [Bacillota bacterium]